MAQNCLLASFEGLWHYGLPASAAPRLISSSTAPSATHLTRKSEVGSLESLFSVMDEDGDGQLSLCDMHSLLTKLRVSSPSTNLESFIERTASNHDADDVVSLDFPQFARLYESLFAASHDCPSQGPVQNEDDAACFHGELLDAFGIYDTNGDGFISAEELGAVLLGLGMLPAEHLGRCQGYIDQVDLNGDGGPQRVSVHDDTQAPRLGQWSHEGHFSVESKFSMHKTFLKKSYFVDCDNIMSFC